MNQMEAAMDKVGVPVKSLRERVWQLLKDRGAMRATHVASILHEDEGATTRAINSLLSEQRVSADRPTGRHYKLYTAEGKTYEESRGAGASISVVSIKPPPAAPAAKPSILELVQSLPPSLSKMSLTELRKTHQALTDFFSQI